MLINRAIDFKKIFFEVFFGLALAAVGAAEVQSQQPLNPKQLPFPAGEELIYQAELSKGLLRGVDVAEFRFTTNETRITPDGAARNDPVAILRFTGDVVSKGFFTKLFRVSFHQQVESVVDRAGFTVNTTKKTDEQNNRLRSSEAIFDHTSHRVTWTERDPQNPSQAPRTVSSEFTEPVQDVLSGIYFLRMQRLEVGKSLEIVLSDSGRVVRVPVNVVERKRLKTPLGYLYALRIEPILFGDGRLVRGEGRFSIWITDDSRHIPLRAQVKVPAGIFDIKLKRVAYQTPR